MAEPDFLRVRCANNDGPGCAVCGRDFIVPVCAIAGIYKMPDGRAEILIRPHEFCIDPNCFTTEKYRFLKTVQSWDAVVALLGSKIVDLGTCNMVQENF